MTEEFDIDGNKGLIYDLRQKYAQIVGNHLELVAIHRLEKDYPKYFSALQDLFTVVAHKIGDNDDGRSKKEEEEIENKKYNQLINKAIQTFREHSSAYSGNDGDALGRALIENVLRTIERFIYKEMDEAGMFGKFEIDDGL